MEYYQKMRTKKAELEKWELHKKNQVIESEVIFAVFKKAYVIFITFNDVEDVEHLVNEYDQGFITRFFHRNFFPNKILHK